MKLVTFQNRELLCQLMFAVLPFGLLCDGQEVAHRALQEAIVVGHVKHAGEEEHHLGQVTPRKPRRYIVQFVQFGS